MREYGVDPDPSQQPHGDTEAASHLHPRAGATAPHSATIALDDYTCPECETETLRVDDTTKYKVCSRCGGVYDSETVYARSFAEIQASSVRSAPPYNRLSHFKEFLTRLEGQERTRIPQVVITTLLSKCAEHGWDPVKTPSLISHYRVRDWLQMFGFSHMFENIVKIIGILTETEPIQLTAEQRKNLEFLFLRIQKPYEMHKGDRKNFLSYSYVTFKLCELLGYTDFFRYLYLLKAPANLLAADRIWKEVCRTAKLEYIPTDQDRGNHMVYYGRPGKFETNVVQPPPLPALRACAADDTDGEYDELFSSSDEEYDERDEGAQ